MKRREFIGVVGGAIVWPLVARAQRPAGRIYRVGYLSITQQLHLIKAFEGGLWSFAYRVGENAVIEY